MVFLFGTHSIFITRSVCGLPSLSDSFFKQKQNTGHRSLRAPRLPSPEAIVLVEFSCRFILPMYPLSCLLRTPSVHITTSTGFRNFPSASSQRSVQKSTPFGRLISHSHFVVCRQHRALLKCRQTSEALAFQRRTGTSTAATVGLQHPSALLRSHSLGPAKRLPHPLSPPSAFTPTNVLENPCHAPSLPPPPPPRKWGRCSRPPSHSLPPDLICQVLST